MFTLELEYALEDNGAALDSTAWNALASYPFESRGMPRISYRYAVFEGDDPGTAANEAFDGAVTPSRSRRAAMTRSSTAWRT